MKRRTLVHLGWTALIAALLGCGDDESSMTGPDLGSSFAEATSPDLLVTNFEKAWQERNLEEYDRLLDEEFVFWFSPPDVEYSPGQQGFWPRSSEITVALAIFSGLSGSNPSGDPIPPVESIAVELTPIDPEWTDASAEGAAFTGSLRRSFSSEVTIHYASSDLISDFRGRQVLYVAADLVDGGSANERTVYRLRHWRELVNVERRSGAVNESGTWGIVKLIFAPFTDG